MAKKLLLTISAFFICLFSSLGQSALAIPQARQMPRLVDGAGLLSTAQADALLAKLDEISESRLCDVAIVTVRSPGGKSPTDYADDFYDYNGYGMGDNDDGILLLISMEGRDWAITTHGSAIRTFTDDGQANIMSQVGQYLSSGNYALAFDSFAALCNELLAQPTDVGSFRRFLNLLPFCLLLGFGLSFLFTAVMKAPMRSVRMRTTANSYLSDGGIAITKSSERFLFSRVSKTMRQSASSKGSGPGTRISSSGRSHGGFRGKF